MSSSIVNRIIVRCAHEKGSRARVTALSKHVVIEYGRFDSQGLFYASETEKLLLNDHPELHGLHDGESWDALILAALVDTFCED